MKRLKYLSFIAALLISSAAKADEIKSFTLEGGPIASKHIQSGDNNFRERHVLAVAKIGTENYGNWALYFLNPNSVRKTSVGLGYVTNPYVLPISGPVKLELSGALGLVTGYQDYPVPLLAGEARLVLFDSGKWNAGIAAAAMPYIAEDDITGENKVGIVATTPFLSIRYNFH